MFFGKQWCGERNSQREGNIEECMSNILGEIKNIIICKEERIDMECKQALDSSRKCLGKILQFSYMFTKYFFCTYNVSEKNIRCLGYNNK